MRLLSMNIKFIVLLIALSAVALSAKNGKKLNLLAWPNPFRADTEVITIALNTLKDFPAKAKTTIYNYSGKVVYSKTYNGRIVWSGFDSKGNRLSPGVYYVKMLLTHNDGGVSTQWYTIAIQ